MYAPASDHPCPAFLRWVPHKVLGMPHIPSMPHPRRRLSNTVDAPLGIGGARQGHGVLGWTAGRCSELALLWSSVLYRLCPRCSSWHWALSSDGATAWTGLNLGHRTGRGMDGTNW